MAGSVSRLHAEQRPVAAFTRKELAAITREITQALGSSATEAEMTAASMHIVANATLRAAERIAKQADEALWRELRELEDDLCTVQDLAQDKAEAQRLRAEVAQLRDALAELGQRFALLEARR